MNPRVKYVEKLEDFRLRLLFANGEWRTFDVKPYLDYPAFKRLRNSGYFTTAHVEHGTVVWPDNIDFCPDTLYLDSVREEVETYLPGKETI